MPVILVVAIVVALALLWTTNVGSGIFSFGTALSLEDDTWGTTDLRRISKLLGKDLKEAEKTSLVDGAGWAPSVTLSWTDRFRGVPLPHVVHYSLEGDRLMRTADGSAKTVAQDVLSTAYSLAESEFRAVFEVRAESGEVETKNLRIGMP